MTSCIQSRTTRRRLISALSPAHWLRYCYRRWSLWWYFTICGETITVQCESNNPSWVLLTIFPNGLEVLVQISHAYYTFLSTLDYKFYSITCNFDEVMPYLARPPSYVQNVYHWPKRTLLFSDISPKQLGIFSPIFTRLLHVPIYARIQIFIQLSPTVTKLCHIKCDHPACVSVDGGQTFWAYYGGCA